MNEARQDKTLTRPGWAIRDMRDHFFPLLKSLQADSFYFISSQRNTKPSRAMEGIKDFRLCTYSQYPTTHVVSVTPRTHL